MSRFIAPSVVAIVLTVVTFHASADAQRGRGGPPAPPSPRGAAPVDLTGQWVSLITEDWRYRQFTPPKGDYGGLPLLPAGAEDSPTAGIRRATRRPASSAGRTAPRA